MKILIFSDSHGDVEIMCEVIEKEKPDMIIHLGDSIADAEQLSNKYPNIKIIKNLGNSDSNKENDEWIQYIDICGKRFMLTHGHIFNEGAWEDVTDDKARRKMLKSMYEHNVDVLLHGHAHEPYLHSTQIMPSRYCWIMCPGRIGRKVNYSGTFNQIYGLLRINEAGIFEWQFIEVQQCTE